MKDNPHPPYLSLLIVYVGCSPTQIVCMHDIVSLSGFWMPTEPQRFSKSFSWLRYYRAVLCHRSEPWCEASGAAGSVIIHTKERIRFLYCPTSSYITLSRVVRGREGEESGKRWSGGVGEPRKGFSISISEVVASSSVDPIRCFLNTLLTTRRRKEKPPTKHL